MNRILFTCFYVEVAFLQFFFLFDLIFYANVIVNELNFKEMVWFFPNFAIGMEIKYNTYLKECDTSILSNCCFH